METTHMGATPSPDTPTPSVKNDITGQVFHRLTAIRYLYTNKHRAAVWEFRCSCVKKSIVEKAAIAVRSGHVKSCGCIYEETRKTSAATHGGCYDPVYQCWNGMMQRCYNPKHISYPKYGGAGVVVALPWHHFPNFKKDVGERPVSEFFSVDRFPDKNGNYTPDNTRWATRKQQQRNRRNNVFLTLGDVTQCQAAWSEELGWHPSKIKNRKRAGWSDERTLTTP